MVPETAIPPAAAKKHKTSANMMFGMSIGFDADRRARGGT